MEQIVNVTTGAEALLELFNANSVDYIFLNPGTDTYDVQEAVAKYKALGKRTPEVILCLHESLAMAAAHGYFMVSGKPQVVLVHTDLGLQQVGGALHNVQRGRIGVVLCSGRVTSNKLNEVQWLQEQYDQASTVRSYVKWEYELRTNENIHQVIQRAFQVASSEPCGPVYLSLPQDLLAQKIANVVIPPVTKHPAVATPQADTTLLAELATALIEADMPLIITGYSGRHLDSVASLVELAELTGARVTTSQVRMNFPTTHPLCSGFESNLYLENADVIVVIDRDVPYVPVKTKPKPDTKIFHIDIDVLRQHVPLWSFPADALIQADSNKALPLLCQMIRQKITPAQQARCKARFQKIQSEHEQIREKWSHLARSKAAQKPISPEWVLHCINEVIDENTIVLEETLTNRAAFFRQIHCTKPGTFFRSSGANLGWGIQAALGTKLASPDKTVITIVGDGSFVFGCPTATLWAASTYHAPFLAIILNNMQYNAPKLTLRQAFGAESYSEKTGKWVGIEIKPPPDYATIARACHAYGQTVEDPSDIQQSIKQALEQVRNGKAAVLDVRLESP